MRGFAYVIVRRWSVFLVATVIATVVGVTALSLGNPLPFLVALATLMLVVPLRLIRVVRLIGRFGSDDWDREVWGPDVEDYPATAAPFNRGRSASTMLRSAITVSGWGVADARYERFDVPGFLMGRGTHVELMHLDHDMPTVRFGRVRDDGSGDSTFGHGIVRVGRGVGFEGDEMLVSTWITERAAQILEELLAAVPWVTLSGSTLYAHGHIAGDGERWNPRVLYLLTQLSLELQPKLRREYGFPVETDPEDALPVTGRRGSRTLVWLSLLVSVVFAPMGAVLGFAAVCAPSERSGLWRLAAWGALVVSGAMIATSIVVGGIVVEWEANNASGEPTPEDTFVPEIEWGRDPEQSRQDLEDAVRNIPTIELPTPAP